MSSPNFDTLLRRHFFRPVGAGCFAPGTAGVEEGRAGSRKQGVAVQLQCKVAAGKIVEARFLAWGCPYSIAAASWLAEKLSGMDLQDAAGIRALSIAELLEVPADRLGSILVVEDALNECLEKAAGRRHV
jgi:NifU-like protein involved in Fe-S cluster formation